MFISVLRFNLF